MNVVKCVNGHFFDSDSYTACPHCGGAILNVTQTQAESEKQKKKGLFGGWKRNSGNTQTSQKNSVQNSFAPKINSVPASNPVPVFAAEEKTDSLPVQSKPVEAPPVSPVTAQSRTQTGTDEVSSPQVINEEDHTSSLWQEKAEDSSYSNSSSESAGSSAPKIFSGNSEHSIQNDEHQSEHSSSLSDEIRKASANSEGKTASYFSAISSERKSSSEAASASQPVVTDPVVGWLVCIEGPHFGSSFNISAGKNSVGRNDTNKIILKKDTSVSREKHALIVYEPKKRNFFIQPGESSGLTYLNEDYITESKKLNAKDIIEIGSSKLIFVPLCDETFTWEDYISKG